VLALAVPLGAADAPLDPEVEKGIRLVDDGDYDGAIVTLDAAARRLAADPARVRDLSQAYLHLGIAYVGKGHEAAAKAKFREAVSRIRDLTLSAERYPPKVIDLFEAARDEARVAAPAAAATPAPVVRATPAPKKGGSKAILLVGGLALAGGGAALAGGGGGGGGGGAATTTPPTTLALQSFQEQRWVQPGEGQMFNFTARGSGPVEVKVQWTTRTVTLGISCQEHNPPYTGCNGRFQRTSDTPPTAEYTFTAAPREYLVVVDLYDSRATGPENFTVQVRYP
jgi:hypothetical protein